jgi:hypothetical protein
MSNEISKYFLRRKVEDTRCPELIRESGCKDEYIYLLKKRTECGEWQHIGEHFVQIKGKQIVTEPVSGRKYFTTEPEKVIAIMKDRGIW